MKLSLTATNQLPICPRDVLRSHRVDQQIDTRFRACARLLQSLWRDRHGIPMGCYQRPRGTNRRLGSMISLKAAQAGRNFMLPAVARVVRHEIAYQEPGAFIDQRRLYANLLASTPLTFNLLAPLRLDLALGTRVIQKLLPDAAIGTVTRIIFEHSPQRRDLALTGDRTAFDAAVVYERRGGGRGFLGVEVKYSETMTAGAPTELRDRYQELATASGLYVTPAATMIRATAFRQLFREHLLAQAALMRGDWDEARFMLIAPRDNVQVQQTARSYAAHVTEPTGAHVPFSNVHLEEFIAALGEAGEEEYASALHERYCDWSRIDEAIAAVADARGGHWQLAPTQTPSNPVAPVGQVS